MQAKKIGLSLCLAVATSAFAEIPTDLSTTEDPKANLQRLIRALTQLRSPDSTTPNNLRDVFANLDAATNRARIRRSLSTLLPEVSRHHAIRQQTTIHQRPVFDARRTPPMPRATNPPGNNLAGINWLASTSTFQPSTQLWLQAWTDGGSQDDESGFDGFDSDTRGLTLGIDHTLTENLTFGASIGSSSGAISSNQFGEDEIDTNEYSVSTGYTKGNHSLNFSISRSATAMDRERAVIIDTDAGTRRFALVSDFDVQQTSYSLGYSAYIANANLAFVPYISATYATLSTDDYVESGGGGLNLIVETQDETALLGSVGGSLSWGHFAGDWLITPNFGLAYERDFRGEATTTFSRFRDTAFSFSTTGFDVDQSRWRYSAALHLMRASGLAMGISYNGHRTRNYSYDAAIISLQIDI